MILKIFDAAKILLKINIAMLHIVRLLKKVLLPLVLGWNLMLNCKHKTYRSSYSLLRQTEYFIGLLDSSLL